ncbi:MAG: glycoside hydrolase family 2 TIM barrel-domain containing protein [Verrucomicrobiales bacterium]|nr:glycoside hydrolase family 2 TIM barrel-domain containing protein [Verrucomicrobiales bacterium]
MSCLQLRMLAGAAALAWAVCLRAASEYETKRMYLSGRSKDDAVPWEFMCTAGAKSGFWTNLPVPSHWEMHGFGTLNYRKDSPEAKTEKGLYRLHFYVPTELAGRRIFLVFEGVMTDTEARLNSMPVGPVHQGGFYRFKYEVTRLLKLGETNLLEVTVAKHSANESVNRAERMADYWLFGGIYRPVYLEVTPPQFIERVAINARHDGEFTMDVYVRGVTHADAEMTIEAQITTPDGTPVGKPFLTELDTHGPRQQDLDRLKARLRTKVPAPRTWTAETPNLYKVEVRLKHGNELLHRHTERFGFRTVEVRDADGIYVNGRKIMLKGVNRHSFWPESGRCLSETVHRLDIHTIKEMNGNAVRMSHYPPDAEFLDLCDELGLYVLNELAGWHNHYDNDAGRKLVEEMVTRDVNHPCILFWCNGNEGGFNTNLDSVFAQFDIQNRRVLHPWEPFNGINTAHYLAYENAKLAAAGKPVYYHPQYREELLDTNLPSRWIYMPTEFLHGMFDGGAGAGIEDYWNMMMRSPRCAGGFIWALTDDGLKRPDTGEIDTAGNQAPDGVVGPYRQREASFYAIKQVWSPIQLGRSADGTIVVTNHYSFTDANRCKFVWQLRKFRQPQERMPGFRVLAEGRAPVGSIPPGAIGKIRLQLPKLHETADALALTVYDPDGRQLWTWTWPLEGLAGATFRNAESGQQVEATETHETILLSAGAITAAIDKRTGLLAGIRTGAQQFSLSMGPRPAVGKAVLTNLVHWRHGHDYVVQAKFDGALRTVTWRMSSNGWLQCNFTYTAAGELDYFGVLFDYPEELVKRKRWLGNGPYRVWKNRLCGQTLNVWENDYNDTITGWRHWVYPEFKGCFADVRWLQLETAEGLITIVPEGVPFVQVLTPAQPPEELAGKTKVNLPQCGLGFLHAIPAIGSKFKPPAQCGPQSQPNVAGGEYSGSVSFYFSRF